jgi:hypothetical protein
MLHTVSRLLPELPLFLMTAVATHLIMSFAQTLMHYKLGKMRADLTKARNSDFHLSACHSLSARGSRPRGLILGAAALRHSRRLLHESAVIHDWKFRQRGGESQRAPSSRRITAL